MYDLQKMIDMRENQKLTLQEIGNEFGISRERVRQLLPKSVNKRAIASRKAELLERALKKEKERLDKRLAKYAIIHGTLRCYRSGCRKPECVQAYRDYSRKLREERYRKFAAGEITVKVHNASTYVNYGCNCEICTKDNTRACKDRYARYRKTKKR